MKKGLKYIVLAAIAVVLIALGAGGYAYKKFFEPNTAFEEASRLVFIHEPLELAAWTEGEQAHEILEDIFSFENTARVKKLSTLKPGRYRIKKGMSNNAIVNMFRSGNQEPLTLRTDDVTTLEALAGKLGKNLRSDSLAFITAFTDEEKCAEYGFNPITIACMFFPDTYEFFWTITPEEFMGKMNKIFISYWIPDNESKAQKISLTKKEVGILASIVKAETGRTQEAPKIAGLYLNRLRINMPLQSDPTATFGNAIKPSQRIYFGDFVNDSPYNTYRNKGLPPGPINFPEKVYLDAVLNAEKHNYLYMCAQPGGTGLHNFAKTFEQHNIYSNQYHKWLNQKGIR